MAPGTSVPSCKSPCPGWTGNGDARHNYFNATWNAYFLPLVFLNSWHKMTLPQGIALLTGYMGSGNPSVVMAAVTMAIIPVLVVLSRCSAGSSRH